VNIRIVLATGLLLTVGTAVAGTLVFGDDKPAAPAVSATQPLSASSVITPEMVAMWRATASADDYIAPKVPI
jgi:hypothetical protein